jgi:hypothetical protein
MSSISSVHADAVTTVISPLLHGSNTPAPVV